MAKLTTYDKIWYYFNNKRIGFLMRLNRVKGLILYYKRKRKFKKMEKDNG